MSVLLDRAKTVEAELIGLRRELHRHPELSFRETRTAATVAERLDAIGAFEIRRGVGRTGIVAELRNGDGPTVALRADMDALPIQEANDVPYRSEVDGVMHACGHDAHMAMLIGAAKVLTAARADGEMPTGTIRLLFQPSEEASDEENKSGATRMIDDGAMDGVDAVFGLHVGAHLPAGRVFIRPGPLMAGSDSVRIEVEGRSAHAARPQDGIDAIVLASQAVLAVQAGIARRLSPLDRAVLTLGRIEGGVAENVIAERVALDGTVRYFEEEVRTRIHDAARRGVAVADALGGRGRLEIVPRYPPVVNDAAMTDLARAAVAKTLGSDALATIEPMMEAEDFGILAREAPGAFFWLGGALEPPREHHHPKFNIEEGVLVRGAGSLAACALRALRTMGSAA